MNKYIKLGIGLILQALGIALVISSGTTFAITSFNQGISNTFLISYGTASFVVEILTIFINYFFKEKIGITTITSAILNGYLVDLFLPLIPNVSPSLIYLPLGAITLAFGFYFMTVCGLGNNSSSGLMNVFQKLTGKPVKIIRTIEDSTFMLMGFLLGGTTNLGTIILTFGFGFILNFIYDKLNFDPTKVQHEFLGGAKQMKLPKINVSQFINQKCKKYELALEDLKINIKKLK